ncbi:MAG: hypothetical protein AAB552_01460 [Patescibacteria group bacterium]
MKKVQVETSMSCSVWGRTALGIGLAILSVSGAGCLAVIPLLAMAPSAMIMGAGAYRAIEEAEVDVTIPAANVSAVTALKKIAIIPSKRTESYTYMGDSTAVAEHALTNVASTIRAEGFEVIETTEIEEQLRRNKVAPIKDQRTGEEFFGASDLIRGAFDLGADAALVTTISYGMEVRAGWFSGGSGTSVQVKTASGRLVDKQSKTLMTVSLTYKNGQPAQEAGKSLGLVTALKITNPQIDVKVAIKERGAKG